MVFNKEKFRRDFISKRIIDNSKSLRWTAIEIGVSAATLNRIEKNKDIDLDTFVKVLEWLDKTPNDYFNISAKKQ